MKEEFARWRREKEKEQCTTSFTSLCRLCAIAQNRPPLEILYIYKSTGTRFGCFNAALPIEVDALCCVVSRHSLCFGLWVVLLAWFLLICLCLIGCVHHFRLGWSLGVAPGFSMVACVVVVLQYDLSYSKTIAVLCECCAVFWVIVSAQQSQSH